MQAGRRALLPATQLPQSAASDLTLLNATKPRLSPFKSPQVPCIDCGTHLPRIWLSFAII